MNRRLFVLFFFSVGLLGPVAQSAATTTEGLWTLFLKGLFPQGKKIKTETGKKKHPSKPNKLIQQQPSEKNILNICEYRKNDKNELEGFEGLQFKLDLADDDDKKSRPDSNSDSENE